MGAGTGYEVPSYDRDKTDRSPFSINALRNGSWNWL